jgi:hypothetical protein
MSLHRCQLCDPPKQKTIDILKEDYIKTENKKYYHINCFRQYLLGKKKSEEEIISIINFTQDIMQCEKKLEQDKDRLFVWMMDYYRVEVISTFVFKKIHDIVTGQSCLIKKSIPYEELLDINALKKNFNDTDSRMHYDLAIVLNNYNKYKEYKEKQQDNSIEVKEIEKQIQNQKVTEEVIKNKDKNNQEYNLADNLNDFLL